MKGLPFEKLEDEFRRYLLEVRGNSPHSIRKHLLTFRKFGEFLKSRRVRAAHRVSLRLVYWFLEQRSRGRARRYVQTFQGSMRHILRFLSFARILPEDFSAQLIVPHVWKFTDVPKAFSSEELPRMLASLRAETPYDHRERLVMLLFICYGLRLGEVMRLNLDDIDSRKKTITVRERKNRIPLVLPLLPPVEESLRDYLEHFRPKDLRTKRIFVTIKRRSRAPLKELAVHEIIKKFLRRCGIKGCATNFRHTLATHLINKGASLTAIQAVLGQQSSESARIYAKVHWEALQEVAQNYSLQL
jgi:integrase/recombinase XerD